MLLTFLMGLATVIWVDVILSGDNAVVIAMACHHLPPSQQKWGMILGGLGAVILRIACTGSVAWLMGLPFAKISGAAFLLWVAVKMLLPQDEETKDLDVGIGLITAVGTIVVADIMMSVDNVVAVAAAAQGDWRLLIIGLSLSIPLIIFGASVISKFIEKYPVLTWAGAGLLGWIAGDMAASDVLISSRFQFGLWPAIWPGLGAGIVIAMGYLIPKMETSDA